MPADVVVAVHRRRVVAVRRPRHPVAAVRVREVPQDLRAVAHAVPADRSVGQRGDRHLAVAAHVDAPRDRWKTPVPDLLRLEVEPPHGPLGAKHHALRIRRDRVRADHLVIVERRRTLAVDRRRVLILPVEDRHAGGGRARWRHHYGWLGRRRLVAAAEHVVAVALRRVAGQRIADHRAIGRHAQFRPRRAEVDDVRTSIGDHLAVRSDDAESRILRGKGDVPVGHLLNFRDAIAHQRDALGLSASGIRPSVERIEAGSFVVAARVDELPVRRPDDGRKVHLVGERCGARLIEQRQIAPRRDGNRRRIDVADGDRLAVRRIANGNRLAAARDGAPANQAEVRRIQPHQSVERNGDDPALRADVDVLELVEVLRIGRDDGPIVGTNHAKAATSLQSDREILSVGRPDQRTDGFVQPADALHQFAGGDVEYVDRALAFPVPPGPARGGHRLPVRRHGESKQLPFVTLVHGHTQDGEEPRLRHLPDADRLIVGRGNQAIASSIDDHASNQRGVHPGLDAQDRRGSLTGGTTPRRR